MKVFAAFFLRSLWLDAVAVVAVAVAVAGCCCYCCPIIVAIAVAMAVAPIISYSCLGRWMGGLILLLLSPLL